MKKKMTEWADRVEGTIEALPEEMEYLLQNDLKSPEGLTIIDFKTALSQAVVERCDKETEELIADGHAILDEPVRYLKENSEHFVYLEAECFDRVGVDGVSLEMNDVFQTYGALLGLKLQKKFGPEIKQILAETLTNGEDSYELLFNGEDGLWDLNLTLNDMRGFSEEATLLEAYEMVYQFIFFLRFTIE